MGWTTPLTAVANSALTAAQWNASVRDNLNSTAPGLATQAGQIFVSTGANAVAARLPTADFVSNVDTTTSTSPVNLTNFGPAVGVGSGSGVIVAFGCWCRNNTSGNNAQMYVKVTGATTIAEAEENSVLGGAESASNVYRTAYSVVFFQSLTPGTNDFTATYKATSTGTASFAYRRLLAIPL